MKYAAYGLLAFAGFDALLMLTGYGLLMHSAIAQIVARLLASV